MLRLSRGGGKKVVVGGVHHLPQQQQMMYSNEMRMQQQGQQEFTASPSSSGEYRHPLGTPVTPLGMEGMEVRDYMEARRNSEPVNVVGTSPMPLGMVAPHMHGMEGIGYPPLQQPQEVYMHPDGFLHPVQQQQQHLARSPLHHPELLTENQNEVGLPFLVEGG
jgi:hypothetical protein